MKTIAQQVDDAVLTLTNTAAAHEPLLHQVGKYASGRIPYAMQPNCGYRGMIYKALKKFHNRDWGSGQRVVTGLVALRIFEHYWEEARDEPYTSAVTIAFYDSCPYWAQSDLWEHHPLASQLFTAPVDKHVDNDKCFFTQEILEDAVPLTPIEQAVNEFFADVPQPQQEPIMAEAKAAPAVEVKTLIYGVDIKDMTDSAVLATIGKLEAEITMYEALANKPKRIALRIEALQKDIQYIVAALDAS